MIFYVSYLCINLFFLCVSAPLRLKHYFKWTFIGLVIVGEVDLDEIIEAKTEQWPVFLSTVVGTYFSFK